METFDKKAATELLIQMEGSVMDAFKNKDATRFTKDFATDYIGVAADGVKNAEGEIKGMNALDLTHLSFENMKVSFPATDIAIMTYTMIAKGHMGKQSVDGSIYSSTVYANRDGRWVVVLHTESMAAR